MNADRWKQVEAIYEAAADLGPSERNALLDGRCAGDEALRAEVESLLSMDEAAGSFLERPAFVIPTPPPLKALAADEPGTMVGRRLGAYRITGVIGAGGMGVVYLAEQEFPRRSVALKVLKPSLATPGMIRRFEHEAQILGRLQHPGIAQIYEAGAAPDHEHPLGSGIRAFFAMEYVKGPPITEFAEKHQLSTAQRLELFAKVCDAVQHAHQKGVIHRDLKPANILVDESGLTPGGTNQASAQPKVLDFGVARATDSDLRATTMRTGIGQLIGTLPYMSPEQISSDSGDIDTRTDVYSLGVILYELLSSKLPHDLKGRSIPEAALIIRDDEPTRLSAISRVYRGEIDTIVFKALEKDRSRRYQSASELADDVRRYLRGEPIAAKRDSALYILRKQINRYRGAFAAAALFVVALVTFSVAMYFQSRENEDLAHAAARSRDEAVKSREHALAALAEAQDQRSRADVNALRLGSQLSESNIERGRMSGRLGNTALAEELLWSEFLRSPTNPHAYWALWEYFMQEPCVWTVRPHEESASSFALSRDERMLYTCSLDGSIAAIDAVTRRILARLPGTDGPINWIELNPDGTVLASVGDSGLLQFWRTPGLELLGCIDQGQGSGSSVAFSPDGSLVATGGADGTIRVWPVSARLFAGEATDPVLILFGHNQGVTSLAFARRDDRLILGSASLDNSAKIWDPITGECLTTMSGAGPLSTALAFTRDGSRVLTGSIDRYVRLWDTRTGIQLWANPRLNGTIRSVALSPDEKYVLAGGWYHIDRLSTETGEADERPLGHLLRANRLAFASDGKHVISASEDGTVRMWESQPLQCVSNFFFGSSGSPGALFLNGDRQVATTGGRAPELRVWDAPSGARLRTIGRLSSQARSIRLSPDGCTLAVGTGRGDILFFDTVAWEQIDSVHLHQGNGFIADMAFTPDGDRLASISSRGTLSMVDLITGECLWSDTSFKYEPLRLALSPDGRTIAVTHREHDIRIYDADTGAWKHTLPTPSVNWSVVFSADGLTLFSGNWKNEIARWDVDSWCELPPLRGHTQIVYALAAGPSGRLIASGSQDTTVKLWDVWSGHCVATLEGKRREIHGLTFSQDGTLVAASKNDGSTDIWDLTHYRRHVAGNIDYQLATRRAKPAGEINWRAIEAWLRAQWATRIDQEALK